jgi:hypothetical protein
MIAPVLVPAVLAWAFLAWGTRVGRAGDGNLSDVLHGVGGTLVLVALVNLIAA